ncbi:MAG: efflux RND transporter permease subunit [Bacteroidales bacterium]
MNLGKWALNNSKFLYFAVVVLIIGGFYSYGRMSKLEDPLIKVKQAMVVTTYPGASPYEVELQVTEHIERAIRSMNSIDKVESQSSADLSLITVTLDPTVPDNQVEQYWDMLRRKVGDIQGKLPKESNSSVVVDDYGDVYGMFYALTSDGFTNRELNQYAELIQREIQNIDGISRVELYGVQTPTINVSIHEDKMANLGVLPATLIASIEDQRKVLYSGYYNSGDRRLRVAVDGGVSGVETIGNTIIQGYEGDQLKLSDIADITIDYATPMRNSLSYDNRSAIGISISALSGTDIIKLGSIVEKRLDQIKQESLPIGVDYHKVFFQPDRVEESIDTFVINLIESVVIVVIVLMFAMGFRSAMLLGMTLVVSVLGTLLMLEMLGGTLQRVSLGAFILAMGMLVDNAIVIVDGILVDLSKGKSKLEALTEIGRKTAMPLLGATLIAILAFLPLFLSPDTVGVYVRDLFIVLAISLMLSWILSLTMVPLQAKFMLRSSSQKPINFDSVIYRWLNKILDWGLKHKWLSLCFALILVACSAILYDKVPQSFFPDMSYDQLYIEYKLPEGVNSTRTNRDLKEITNYLLSREDVKHVTSSVGGTPSRYNLVRSIATPSLSYGELIVDFNTRKELVNSISEIQDYLSDSYPESYVRLKRYNLMYNKYPIEAMFIGPDPDVLADLASKARSIMQASDKVMLVTTDWDSKSSLMRVGYENSLSSNIGLSRQDVYTSIMASTDGVPVGTIYDGNVSHNIVVRCVNRDGVQLESLESIPIFSMLPSTKFLSSTTVEEIATGAISQSDIISESIAKVPLGQIAKSISLGWEAPLVIRYNGQRAIRVQANNIPSVGAESARLDISQAIESIELPDGYSLSWEGEYVAKSSALKYLLSNLPLAVILMISLLILLFRDYKKPLIIILCVPLLLVGALFGVMIAGKSFGFVAICGVLGLIGMMIKNGVVLMDEIEMLISQGGDPKQALLESVAVRFRPVMMASLTTILGMIPLLSDDMFGSLAATIMGGLFVGTLVTLLFIPILYSILFKIQTR